MEIAYKIIDYTSVFLALLLVLPVHEFAHAFVADRLGDKTARLSGRLTLHPIKHFDIYGLICMLLVHFGWAKPVPVNPYNFKNPRRDMFFVSIAGVLANLILAFIFCPLFYLVQYLLTILPFSLGAFGNIIIYTFYYVYWLSLAFFVFNLLPFYPLDGFRVIDCFNRKHGKVYRFLRDYGQYVLLTLVALSFIADFLNIRYINILGYYLETVVGYLSYPIVAFWGLFI